MKNNKGFVLVETLIVSVFIMLLFSIIYTNFYPLLGEYEKIENYNTMEGIYKAYYIKENIEDFEVTEKNNLKNTINTTGYVTRDCTNIAVRTKEKNLCNAMNITRIIISKFKTDDPKDPTTTYLKDIPKTAFGNTESSNSLKAYIDYLPNYVNKKSTIGAAHRLVIEYTYKRNTQTYYYYSTIEVNLE